MLDGMHTFILKKEDFKELYRKCRISGIVGNIRIYENSLIIQKYFRTPLKRDKKFSNPMKMLQNILVPPLFHSVRYPALKMAGPLFDINSSMNIQLMSKFG